VLIAASVIVAPASVHFGIRWATATDVSYLFVIGGILMAMMTIRAEKDENKSPVYRKK
jgi:hypothetical protein